ncbi:MAG: hypothetical protein WCI67_20660 [Chloroflexales bacterium]
MSTYPVRTDHRWMRGTHGGRCRLGQIAWYEAAPTAVSPTAIHAAVTLHATSPTSVTTEISQPDVPRTISVTGNAETCAGNVVITGQDAAGRPLVATVTLAGTATITSLAAFGRVASVLLPARAAAANTVSVGVGQGLGLVHTLATNATLMTTLDDGADDGTLSINATDLSKNLFTPEGVLDGAKVVRVLYVV